MCKFERVNRINDLTRVQPGLKCQREHKCSFILPIPLCCSVPCTSCPVGGLPVLFVVYPVLFVVYPYSPSSPPSVQCLSHHVCYLHFLVIQYSMVTHSLTESLTHSLTHSLTRSLARSLASSVSQSVSQSASKSSSCLRFPQDCCLVMVSHVRLYVFISFSTIFPHVSFVRHRLLLPSAVHRKGTLDTLPWDIRHPCHVHFRLRLYMLFRHKLLLL